MKIVENFQVLIRANDKTKFSYISGLATKKMKKGFLYENITYYRKGINHDLTIKAPEAGFSFFVVEFKIKFK